MFTAKYAGFVNGDTYQTLTTPVGLTTTATKSSAVGSYPITASGAVAANYTIGYVAGSLTVTQASPDITWATPAAITYGTGLSSLQLNATSAITGTFIYQPPIGTLLDVGSNQLMRVTFTPADANNYKTIVVNNSISVYKAVLSVKADSKSRAYGKENPLLTATISGFVNGESTNVFINSLAVKTAASISSPVGVYPITPYGIAANNYEVEYVIASMIITSAVPVVTWTNPQNLPAGVPIGDKELNAVATVAGTFSYSPPVGAVLPVGTNTLVAAFKPDDTVNYQSVTSRVELVVNSADLVITKRPESQTLIPGTNILFTVEAQGSGTLSYQWKKGDAILRAETNSVLSLLNVQLSDAGIYSVVVSNSFGLFQIASASLATLATPEIIVPPSNQSVIAGMGLSLRCLRQDCPCGINGSKEALFWRRPMPPSI